MTDLERLKQRLAQFAQDRDWDQFHSPKNLASALVVEAGELLEQFQWMTEPESLNLSEKTLKHVSEEMADVLLYLLRLSDKLNVDLIVAADKKIDKNGEKYPVERSRGSSRKYTEL